MICDIGIYALRDRLRLAAQCKLIQIERLGHQRGPAEEDQVPRAATGRGRIVSLLVASQNTPRVLLLGLYIEGTDIHSDFCWVGRCPMIQEVLAIRQKLGPAVRVFIGTKSCDRS